jgi:hypothetical protein
MKSFISSPFLVFLFGSAYSRGDAVISGRIYDKSSREPLPFATVTLNLSDNSKILSGVVTNEEGRFSITGIPQGEIFNDFGIKQEISGHGFTAVYENFYETQIVSLGFKYNF